MGLIDRKGWYSCTSLKFNTKAHIAKNFVLPEGVDKGLPFTKIGTEYVAHVFPFVVKKKEPVLFCSVFDHEQRSFEVWIAEFTLAEDVRTDPSMWHTILAMNGAISALNVQSYITKNQLSTDITD